jgi:hypothetical protein
MNKPTFTDYADAIATHLVQIAALGSLAGIVAGVAALMADSLAVAVLVADWTVTLWVITLPPAGVLAVARLAINAKSL